MSPFTRTSRESGFSLVELLIATAILGIITALVIPQFAGVREATLATRQTYDEQAFINMSNQLRALGYTNSITQSNLAVGITYNVLNATGGINAVTFRLQ